MPRQVLSKLLQHRRTPNHGAISLPHTPAAQLATATAAAPIRRQAEWKHHSHAILAWPSPHGASYKDLPPSYLRDATKDVTAITEAVAGFEPVTLLVTPGRRREAERRFNAFKGRVEIQTVHDYDDLDLWTRDIAPTFVLSRAADGSANRYGVDFNFNGWGNKQPIESSTSLASTVLSDMETPRLTTSLVSEGGALEVDGEGTLMATESSIINDNRNPGMSRDDVEHQLRLTLGIEKFIWIPGRKKTSDITDIHIDSLARFVEPGKVVISRPNQIDNDLWTKVYHEAVDVLRSATDAKGRRLEISELVEADMYSLGLSKGELDEILEEAGEHPPLTYVNYFLVNGGVIFPQFGDGEADAAALKTIKALYSDRVVKTVMIEHLPFMGGGIHCATQEVPA